MNWFNIVLILISQSILFWFISQMYEKTSPFFNAFKNLFLVMALINIFVTSLCLLFISHANSITSFNIFSIILFSFQGFIFVIILFSYIINYFLRSVDNANKL